MKAGWDARERARKEKEREREEREAGEKREEEERNQDLRGWSTRLKKQHEVCRYNQYRRINGLMLECIQTLMTKIKDRARRKAALSDRKSAAAQARMKNIANLAADERVPKKRRKAGGGEYNYLPPTEPA